MTAILVRRNPRRLLRTALIIVAYLCAFIILDLISYQFEELRGIVAWYPPAGLTYALLLVFGARFTPAVTIALLISSVFIYHMPQAPPPASIVGAHYIFDLWRCRCIPTPPNSLRLAAAKIARRDLVGCHGCSCFSASCRTFRFEFRLEQ